MTWSRGGLINEMSEALWVSVSQTRGKAPAPVRKAAGELADLYEEVNNTDLRDIAGRLHRSGPDLGPADVGDILVSYALGAGASWGDVVAASGIRVPTFTAELESRDGHLEFVWDGHAEVQNPARKDVHAANGHDRIILLEDDPVMQAGTTKMLGRIFKGTPVIVSDNVDAAIANIKVHMVGLIVSDVDVLGDKSGIDLFHWVEENRPDLVDRFVFFTGNTDAEREHYRYLPKGGALAKDLKEVIFARPPARDTDRMGRPSSPRAPTRAAARTVQVSRPPARLSAPPVPQRPALAVAPPRDFAADFEAAFRQIDTGHNYVLLYDLRRELPQYTRQEFDAGVNDLRRAKVLSLDSADGRHVKLTDEQLAGGIFEGDSRLQYAFYRQRLGRAAPPAPARQEMSLQEFGRAVNSAADGIGDESNGGKARGRFGEQKVFVSAIWRRLADDPRFANMTVEQFHRKLLDAHRQRLLTMARADLVAAMDDNEVVESEINANGATFHFVINDAPKYRYQRSPSAGRAATPAPMPARHVVPRAHHAPAPTVAPVGGLADAIIDAAKKVDPEKRNERGYGRYGSKVFVSAIWRRIHDDPRVGGMSYEQFKKKLVDLNRTGAIVLARADLVGALDPSEVSESEIEDRGAEFHFVMSERDGR